MRRMLCHRALLQITNQEACCRSNAPAALTAGACRALGSPHASSTRAGLPHGAALLLVAQARPLWQVAAALADRAVLLLTCGGHGRGGRRGSQLSGSA
jgi:hypothetical protein